MHTLLEAPGVVGVGGGELALCFRPSPPVFGLLAIETVPNPMAAVRAEDAHLLPSALQLIGRRHDVIEQAPPRILQLDAHALYLPYRLLSVPA